MDSKTVLFVGPITTRSGYGARSRDVCHSLIELGYDLTIIPTGWGTTPMNVIDDKLLPYIAREPIRKEPDIFIQCTIPSEFQRGGKISIGLTAGIETDNCPVEWLEGCNKMDMVLVSSEHSKRVFENVKYEKRRGDKVIDVIQCTRPIHVLFEGVDIKTYTEISPEDYSTPECIEDISNIPEDFAYLFVGHWLQGEHGHDRKDVGKLVEVFLRTFMGNDPKPALILKTSTSGFSVIERNNILDKLSEIINNVHKLNSSLPLPKVYLINGEMSDDEMNMLYNHPKVKAMVSFTKGEGFGRPLLEFTTTGKPVIAPEWSGQLDFLHPKHSTLLKGSLTKVHQSATNKWIVPDSKWFTVNYTLASNVLWDCYLNYELYYKRSRGHVQYTIDNFSMDRMTDRISELISIVRFNNMVGQSFQVRQQQHAPQQIELKLPNIEKVTENE